MKAFALRRGGKRVWESLWSLGFYSLPNFLIPFRLRTIINFGPVPPLNRIWNTRQNLDDPGINQKSLKVAPQTWDLTNPLPVRFGE